jgi:hypothetical protein
MKQELSKKRQDAQLAPLVQAIRHSEATEKRPRKRTAPPKHDDAPPKRDDALLPPKHDDAPLPIDFLSDDDTSEPAAPEGQLVTVHLPTRPPPLLELEMKRIEFMNNSVNLQVGVWCTYVGRPNWWTLTPRTERRTARRLRKCLRP